MLLTGSRCTLQRQTHQTHPDTVQAHEPRHGSDGRLFVPLASAHHSDGRQAILMQPVSMRGPDGGGQVPTHQVCELTVTVSGQRDPEGCALPRSHVQMVKKHLLLSLGCVLSFDLPCLLAFHVSRHE